MTTRRTFLSTLAGLALLRGASAADPVPPPSRRTRRNVIDYNSPVTQGEVSRIADIWGQPGNYFETLEVGADKSKSAYEHVLFEALRGPLVEEVLLISWPEDRRLGHRHLRIHWDSKHRSGSFSIPIFKGHALRSTDPTEGRVVHCRYMVRVSENFSRAVVDSGKLLGFSSSVRPPRDGFRVAWPNEPRGRRGTLLAGNGGNNVHGNDGWSARGGYDPRPKSGGEVVPIYTYSYLLDQEAPDGRILLHHEILKRYEEDRGFAPGSGYLVRGSFKELTRPGEVLINRGSKTGSALRWAYGTPGAVLVPGRWHRVDQIMAINTPGRRDGWIHAFIDGQQVAKIEKLRWRNPGPYLLAQQHSVSTRLGIGRVWANFYQGGGGLYKKMTEEAHIDVYGVAVKVLEWDE